MAVKKHPAGGREKGKPLSGLFGDARSRLLFELCGHPQTASELADRVETSSNAVRVHLDGLQAAGLVDYRVERRGVGKPRHVYAITAAAENLLSIAYATTLKALLAGLEQRLDGGFNKLMREVGAWIGAQKSTSGRKGFPAAVAAFESLGASVSASRTKRGRELSAKCCPLAAVTRDTPGMCGLVESLLESASGLEVVEHCVRGQHPRCRFLLST